MKFKMFVLVVLVVTSLVLLVVGFLPSHDAWLAIDAPLERTTALSDLSAISKSLDGIIRSMEVRGIVEGRNDIFIDSQLTNVSYDYEALKGLKERALLLASKDKSSIDYTNGLMDIRDNITRIDVAAQKWVLIRNPYFVWGCILLIVSVVYAIYLLIIW